MNQILQENFKPSKTNKYQIQFIICSSVAIIFLVILFTKLYQNHQQSKIAQELLDTYQISTLSTNQFSNLNGFDSSKNNTYNNSNLNLNSGIQLTKPFVIGMIKIDKLQLNYPILSETNDDLLKISVCRFAGPMPNEVGNLCIAGHNYIDNRFFSRLDDLKINDKIEIYGLDGNQKEYKVYKKYEVNADDLSCTNQDIGNNKIITLITCDNFNNNKRLVIQAK